MDAGIQIGYDRTESRMKTSSPSREQKLYDALKRISQYSSVEQIRKTSKNDYGLIEEEAIEMAYNNVLNEASSAIRGMRRPK